MVVEEVIAALAPAGPVPDGTLDKIYRLGGQWSFSPARAGKTERDGLWGLGMRRLRRRQQIDTNRTECRGVDSVGKFGRPGGDRTHDHSIKSRMLYR
jgi:hypothetical protein